MAKLLTLRITQEELEELRGLAATGREEVVGTSKLDEDLADRAMQRLYQTESLRWSLADQQAALDEGWDIFTTDGCESEPWRNSVLMINKEDGAGVFDSDEAALVHVIEKAESGSDMHLRALEIHMTLRDKS